MFVSVAYQVAYQQLMMPVRLQLNESCVCFVLYGPQRLIHISVSTGTSAAELSVEDKSEPLSDACRG